MRIVIALAVALALGGFHSSAHAGNDVGVVVTGEGTMQSQLAAQLENWLSQHGHRLVQTPLPAEAIPLLDDCFVMMDPKACVRSIIEKRAKSSSTVYAHVKSTNNVSNGTRDVALTAYWIDKGRDALTESTTCNSCTDELLRTTADDVMKKLAPSIVGRVKLRSNPQGAKISIDGQAPIGVTPLDTELPVGKHTIRMTGDDLEPRSEEILIVRDQVTPVSLELSPKEDAGGRPSRVLPYSLIAGGAVLIAGGAVLVATDQDGGPGAPANVYDSATRGIIIGGVGVLAVAAGTYLLLRTPSAASTPVVAITSETAYVGWLGRF